MPVDSCTGTGTAGHEVRKDGPLGAAMCCVVVGNVGASGHVVGGDDGKIWCWVGIVVGEVARDEKVGGGVELVEDGNEVVGGHEECNVDGCPKRCST